MKDDMEERLLGKLREPTGDTIIMMELPSEDYFSHTADTVDVLIRHGYDGVYVSFQRPFRNLVDMLDQRGVATDRMTYVDVATAFEKDEGDAAETEEDTRCIHISPGIDIDELVRAIYRSVEKQESDKLFIFIDSLTTVALHKPLSEVMRFTDFLVGMIRGEDVEDVILVFNVAEDLAQKRFIQDVAIHVDEVFKVKP